MEEENLEESNMNDSNYLDDTIDTEPQENKEVTRRKNLNVFFLGLAFLLMYTAFQTMNGILQTVLDSYHHYHPASTTVNGLVSLGIFYGVCAIATWLAPSVITVISSVAGMVIGGFINTAYMVILIFTPNAIAIYVFSVFTGFAGALIWVGQGTVLIVNSTPSTIGRNTGIFFLMFESSLFVGNMIIYFTFNGEEYIEDKTRSMVFSILAGVSLAGMLVVFGIRPLERSGEELVTSEAESKWQKAKRTAKIAFFSATKMIQQKDLILQSFMWAYNGLEITFWSGVFPTCIGNTLHLANRNSVIGLAGIVVGVGEMLGAFITMVTGRNDKPPRGWLTLFGTTLHAAAFFLCFLILPEDSPTSTDGTQGLKWIYPTSGWVITIAFLLGLGDSMFQNQIVSLMGVLYPDDESATASFALFQFIQCLFAAAAFFYSSYISLQWQLLILCISLFVGTSGYLFVEKEQIKID